MSSDTSLKEISQHDRIYIDGCLDMMHHGHSGAIRQAKTMGKYLVCGVHSDEEIAHHKGIPVMNMEERCAAASAVKWVDELGVGAPYVMDLSYMDAKQCQYVVHGDDITTDANGVDCYQEVKDKGRFLVCKRTPSISTTDLVGRMLLHTRDHHYSVRSDAPYVQAAKELYSAYATDKSAMKPETAVFRYLNQVSVPVVKGNEPMKTQEVVYVSGGWDLFTAGHVELLKAIHEEERYVIVGVHNDNDINAHKGMNYPIMNLKERVLTILACRYVQCVIMEAPWITTPEFLKGLPFGVCAVYHGPRMTASQNGYDEVIDLVRTVQHHRFEYLDAHKIVERILQRRDEYLERQRKKGLKADNEVVLRAAEQGHIQ